MTHNIMKEYTEHTKKFIHLLMREYFEEKYNKKIVQEYIESYIEARYSNYGGNENQRVFYRRIYSALKDTCEKLTYNEEDEEKIKDIKNVLEIFQYIFYIDFVRTIKIELKEFVNQMYTKRITKFEMKKDSSLKEKLLKMIKKYRDEKEKFLKSFETDDFELITTKYPLIKDVYKVDLEYKFKFPYIYSSEAIADVYNENVVNEDKIMIQYILLTVSGIKRILEGKFNGQYLVELPNTLLKKNKKLEQILKIIDAPVIQEIIKIKIKYKDFIIYRNTIYDLMKKGYRFAIIIDESFIINKQQIKKLEIFDYILINKSKEYYEEFQKYEQEIEKIIINEG